VEKHGAIYVITAGELSSSDSGTSVIFPLLSFVKSSKFK